MGKTISLLTKDSINEINSNKSESQSFAGDPANLWHPKFTTYRCFLPDLTGFAGLRRTGLSPLQKTDFILYSIAKMKLNRRSSLNSCYHE